MTKNLSQIFEELLFRYVSLIEKDYVQKFKKARNKERIIAELNKATEFGLEAMSVKEEWGQIIEAFNLWYERGEDIDKILAHIRKTFGEDVSDIRPYRKIEDGKKITVYISQEDKALKDLALDDKKLLKLLIRYTAYSKIHKRLPTMFNEELKGINSQKNLIDVKWTSEKGNKNEFVQLIYALHKAGLINNGKGEITKIVGTLADLFSVELGANWQGNLSSSIHKAKIGSNPEIFKKLKAAYEIYANELVEHKRKNS